MIKTVKKGIGQYCILILTLILSVNQTAFAQFTFEIPKLTTENFRNFSMDGIYKEQELPAGIYIIRITSSSSDGSLFEKIGGITLIR
jgi:hypothetical protein